MNTPGSGRPWSGSPPSQEYLQGARPSLSQNAIDQLFAGPDPAADSVPQLSKGLNEATLNMIRRFLAEHPEDLFTSEQIAEQIHLSRITIRRYMNYLVDIGEIVSSIDYKTGGRPSIQYSLGPPELYALRPAGLRNLRKSVTYLLKLTFPPRQFILFL